MAFLDDAPISFECPGCGHEFSETLGRLKANPEIECPGCAKPIQIQSDESVHRAVKKADKAIDDLRRTIKRFNKGR